MNTIYFYYTIKGDDLSLVDISNDIPVSANLYEKGRVYFNNEIQKKYAKPQKTNRWSYFLISEKGENINDLLKKAEKDLSPFWKMITSYTSRYHTLLDIVVYEESGKFNLRLTKKSMDIIDKMNAKLSISFFDW